MMKKLLLLLFGLSFTLGFAQNWGEQEVLHPNPGTQNNFPNNIQPLPLNQNFSFEPTIGDRFGHAVEIVGDYAAISATGIHSLIGVVHIYKKDANGTWNHFQEIEEHTWRQYHNFFGHSLALNGDFLFVGSPDHRKNEAQYQEPAGAVLVYKKDVNGQFVGTQILKSNDIAIDNKFGSSIASQGDYLFIGAFGNDTDENNQNSLNFAGAIYVFTLDANGDWQQVQKIVPSIRHAGDYFGRVIDFDGNYLITGSEDTTDENNQNPNTDYGSVFVFKKDANNVWQEVQKLKSSDPANTTTFGLKGMSISGDFLSIGTKYSITENGIPYHAVFLYKKDTNGVWNEHQKLKIENSSDKLGLSLSMNDHLLITSDPEYSYFDNGIHKAEVGAVNLFVKNDANTWVYVDRYLMSTPIPYVKASGGASPYGGGSTQGYNQVAVDGNTFLFGVPLKDRMINGANRVKMGAAYFSGDVDALGLLSAPLSVENTPLENLKIKAYPNPTTDKLFIHFNNHFDKINIQVINILGKTVLKQQFTNSNTAALQLKMLSKGIYLAKITLNNKQIKIVKFIKK